MRSRGYLAPVVLLSHGKCDGLAIGAGDGQLGAADSKPLRINQQVSVHGLLHEHFVAWTTRLGPAKVFYGEG